MFVHTDSEWLIRASMFVHTDSEWLIRVSVFVHWTHIINNAGMYVCMCIHLYPVELGVDVTLSHAFSVSMLVFWGVVYLFYEANDLLVAQPLSTIAVDFHQHVCGTHVCA